MFKNILIPLDGSKLAETALPPALSIAQTLKAPITLLHIIEKDAPMVIHNDHHLTKVDEAIDYLNTIAENSGSLKLLINTHVHTAEVKDVAASIIQHASEEFSPDLIIMCAHGQSGIRDIVFGNIAQQVLAGGQQPLLLLQPKSTDPLPFSIKKIFVPLDSESKHDESLLYALELARAYSAELYLQTVIPTFGTLTGKDAAISNLMPVTTTAFLEILEETAREHLQIHLNEIIDAGLNVNAEIGRGDPADVISATASRINADLIILSTHRKTGIEAFWSRSVAPNIVKKTFIPILFIPMK